MAHGQDQKSHQELDRCTAVDADWGDAPPNLLMHPPCECPRCAPPASLSFGPDAARSESVGWLRLPGRIDRLKVTAAELGEAGRAFLG